MSDDKRWDESLGVARGRTSTWADRQVAGLCQTAFVEGVRWADANPQPDAITRARAVADSHPDPRCDRYSSDDAVTCGWKLAYTHMLDALGIEVEVGK